MADHSLTPLAKKMGLKPGQRLALVGAPTNWRAERIPHDVDVVPWRSTGRVDIVVAFFGDRSGLDNGIGALASRITANGALWLAWPRRASGHESDITDNEVRRIVLPLGLVDVKVAALDEDWSALKFVWRKERRASLQ